MAWGLRVAKGDHTDFLPGAWPEDLETVDVRCFDADVFPRVTYDTKKINLIGDTSYPRKLKNARFKRCEFNGDFGPVEFEGCSFEGCLFHFTSRDREGVIMSTKFQHCKFENCTFSNIKFISCAWVSAVIYDCRFDMNCVIENIDLRDVHELHTCSGLYLARDDSSRAGQKRLAVQLRMLELPISEFFLSWERLRTVGRLPLFGASFVALIVIPTIIFLLAAYNEQARRIAEIATRHPDLPEHMLASLRAVHEVPIPSLTFLTLVATVLLGIASSIFTLLCPSRIKEFSADRWFDELQQSVISYVPLSWTHRWPRVVAGICYLIGGLIALYVLLSKLYNAGAYILAYTHAPWWLR